MGENGGRERRGRNAGGWRARKQQGERIEGKWKGRKITEWKMKDREEGGKGER
jgi:hypothetical protein